MYKIKPSLPCEMPDCEQKISALVLNASLKHEHSPSNTGEVADEVLNNLSKYNVAGKIIRLSDKNIPVGLGFRESEGDDWPQIVSEIKQAQIVIFATPIWWGGRSSLMQRVIERLDALDEEYISTGRSALYNKVAGIVITGSEDGALATMGSIMTVLTWMGFTLPPECCAYWVGEVGQPTATDAKRRRANAATKHMASNLARNLAFYARLLNQHPLNILKE